MVQSVQAIVNDHPTHLYKMPSGPMYALDDYCSKGKPQRWVSIGTGERCNIRLEDPLAEEYHCCLLRDDRELLIKDDKAADRTLINGIPFVGELGEVLAGNLITVGLTTFLACGKRGAEQELLMYSADQIRRIADYQRAPERDEQPVDGERKTRTRTRDYSVDGRDDPVRYLRLLPDGPLYTLQDLVQADGSEIAIGASARCAIRIDDTIDDTVSSHHCVLERRGRRWFVRDAGSTNGSYVNGVPLEHGEIELVAGSLLTVSKTMLLACGRLGTEQRPDIVPADRQEYAHRTLSAFGTPSRAARMIGVARSTLLDWLNGKPDPGQDRESR